MKILKPVFWGFALLAVALAARSDIIPSRTAAFLLLVLPLVYILGRNRAAVRRGCTRGA